MKIAIEFTKKELKLIVMAFGFVADRYPLSADEDALLGRIAGGIEKLDSAGGNDGRS